MKALSAWRRQCKTERVFGVSSPRLVERVAKRVADLAGEDPRGFGGHSCRAAFLTTASKNGADLVEIMAQSHHSTVKVALGYIRGETVMDNKAAMAVSNAL